MASSDEMNNKLEKTTNGSISEANSPHETAAVEKVRQVLLKLGCHHTDIIESPILGAEGNREFLLYGSG